MPRKAPRSKTEETIEQTSQTNSDKVTIQLPSFFRFLKKLNANQILVLLLVIAAFLIGVLFTKIRYLEQGQSGTTIGQTGTTGGTVPSTGPAQKVNVGLGHFPVKGNKDAKVTIVEFADFRCPF